jgi:hypothetical protein
MAVNIVMQVQVQLLIGIFIAELMHFLQEIQIYF